MNLAPSAPMERGFPRTARFAYRRFLGAGAFGAVYEAYDHERKTSVALKTLRHLTADALLSFKREFRSIADLTHPNLIRLHELISEDAEWFFTMELIEGTDLLSYIRREPSRALDGLGPTLDAPISGDDITADALPPTARAPLPDTERLRDTFLQLADGLTELHARGKLHRDLKPSNVLVTAQGRVVIVDFGLVAELTGAARAVVSHTAGTPAYMAPEQATEQRLSPACDWYAAGVMLHEALTGQLPFPESGLAVLLAKQEREPPPPSALVPAIPPDLDALCADLLRLSPDARPTGSDVLQRLGGAAPTSRVAPRDGLREAPVLVGRDDHLAALWEAFSRVKQGKVVTVHVRGASGMGKTALVHRFLHDLARAEDAVILEGRCYEREAVPYKGVDNLIDALTRYLTGLPEAQAAALLPRDVHAIVRLFPVLERVPAIAASPRRGAIPSDAQELRRRGFLGLRELFARMADRGAVVLYIDDLQWGDADSAALIAEVFRPPDAPALLMLASYRSEDADQSALLRNLPPWISGKVEAMLTDVQHIVVGPLPPAEAAALSQRLLGAEDPARAAAIAREAGHSPFFIHELARARPRAEGAEIRLDAVLAERLDRLPAHARRLLDIVAAAGHPLPRAVAAQVSAESLGRAYETIESLCAAHLLRTRGPRAEDEVETFHDRIREAAVARLSPEARAEIHLALAVLLETQATPEPHILALHFRGGGKLDKAAQYSILAGDRAAQTLAFERAARLYTAALELDPPRGPADRLGLASAGVARRALLTRLADALSNAGRGAEAARAYLDAAEAAPPGDAVELRRRAAECYLRSGYYDEGMTCLRDVLAAVDLDLPATPATALAHLLARRAQLKVRGLRFRERAAEEIAPAVLRRIDVCWSAALGLAMIDNVRGSYFQTRNLLLSLDAGEPYRVARAVAMEVPFVAIEGGPARARIAELLSVAEVLAARAGSPHAAGLVKLVTGSSLYCTGRWREAIAALDESNAILRDQCTGVQAERNHMMAMAPWALWFHGDLRELSRRIPIYLHEAEERGDRYLSAQLRSYLSNAHWLIQDDPEGARRAADKAIESWSRAGFHLQHLHDLVARAHIFLYEGDAEAAHATLLERWGALQRSMSLRLQVVRIYMTHLRGRTALACAAGRASRGREALLDRALSAAKDLEGEKMHWAEPLAALLRAGVAAVRGDRAAAGKLAGVAARGFAAVEMGLFAAAARRREGEMRGGEEGRGLVDEATQWMIEQGVKRPSRMAAMVAPGFGSSGVGVKTTSAS